MPASATGFRLATRLDEVGFSDIVQIRNRVMELRARGATVYQFEGGEPYRATPDYVKDAISSALRENKTRYAPSSGISELRRAIAEKLKDRNHIPASEENVIVVNGGMQGLFGAFQSVVNPGDSLSAAVVGAVNPGSASTTYTVTVSTTSDVNPIASCPYYIGTGPSLPSVVAVTPSSGPKGGGTTVTITFQAAPPTPAPAAARAI